MKIKIYQIDMKKDVNRVCFMNYSFTERHEGVNPEIYKLVYEGSVDADDLEKVYEIFNINHPVGYRGRSLSVSDVVEVVETNEFYYCDSFGFKKIIFNL